jgi:hypothetical protein
MSCFDSFELRFQRRQFLTSSGCEIQRIKRQEHVSLPAKLREADLALKLIREFKIGSR